jgi:hypothetical protein
MQVRKIAEIAKAAVVGKRGFLNGNFLQNRSIAREFSNIFY